ncbi:asparagine synthetase [Firmicutes bacterium CAG:345]|nr:asparagine synthetase [Firmicutes bacterium CAG:345]
MCSIIGLSKCDDFEKIKKSFEKSNSRGPDGTSYYNANSALLGFKRLAIMGLNEFGMQPFSYDDKVLVCNGEIYGFRDIKIELLKKGYSFKSDSDCEILLPLFKEFGFEMFSKLDAEFALIIYDKKEDKIIAARDPLGIRPLYYGKSKSNDTYIFASEPKILVDLVEDIFPFPPGYYFDGEKFIQYSFITDVESKHTRMRDVEKNIHSLLVEGVRKRLDSDAPIGFLLSGGLDSSLVCSIATKILKKPIETFAIGMEKDAIDLKYAKEVADYLKTNHHEVIITIDDVISSLEEVIYNLATYDITTIRASVGMYLLCKYIHENTDIKVLLTGEISDELFGYKYTDYAPNPEEFQKESKKRIDEIHMYDVLRADRCISSNSLEARVPFGDLAFVKYVMEIDPKIKMNRYNKGKYLLRKAFEGDYLPKDILYREKAAFSDAVGHSLVEDIKEFAEDYYTDEEFEINRKKYTFAQPFTKESLMYREIFEKYYPGQAHMIKDFWMPNKSWKGCDVDDPSARFLKNYGDSGK